MKAGFEKYVNSLWDAGTFSLYIECRLFKVTLAPNYSLYMHIIPLLNLF